MIILNYKICVILELKYDLKYLHINKIIIIIIFKPYYLQYITYVLLHFVFTRPQALFSEILLFDNLESMALCNLY